MSDKKLTYSILMPTLHRPELVKDFLDGLSFQTRLPDEVILIDQSDDDLTRKVFENWNAGNIKKTYMHRNIKSLILARNAGISNAKDVDLIAFFDDDLRLEHNFCEEVIRIFESDQNYEYAGGMGAIAGWKYKFKPLQAFFLMPHEGDGKFLASGVQTFPHWKKSFCDTEFLSGGCTFWRLNVIKRFLFDERLSGYGHGDDIDVSYRVSRQHKLFFQPKAVSHEQPNPPGRDNGRVYRRTWIQNMFYLVQKNNISRIAFFWCVFGHILRDLFCLDFNRFRGDMEGVFNIFRNKIDTVAGYNEFIKLNKKL